MCISRGKAVAETPFSGNKRAACTPWVHSIFILTRGCLRAGGAIWRAASQRRAEENVTARLHFGRTLQVAFSHIKSRKSRLKNDYLIRYHTFRGEEFPKHTRAKAAPTPIAETPLEASAGPIIWRSLSFWHRAGRTRRIAIKLEQGRCPHDNWARARIADRSATRRGARRATGGPARRYRRCPRRGRATRG